MTMDLSTIPFVAISARSKEVISMLLNPLKVLPCENNLPRDWRGLAHLLNINRDIMPLLVQHSDPTMYMFTMLEQNQKDITIKHLQTMFEQIDRWDIIDDTETLLENDAMKYMEQQQRAQVSADIIEQSDREVLTLGDIHRLKQGLETQYYDAFLLYADEDAGFANEVTQRLETEYNLKLCLKDRDLVGGLFEHEAVMKLISDRCNRLLIIISPNFLKSSANTFFLNYTQALSIDKRQRKIIPCMYKSCQLPPQLRYTFTLDYNRKELFDFWGKLCDSIQVPTIRTPVLQTATVQAPSEEISSVQLTHNVISSTIKEVAEERSTSTYKHSNMPQIYQQINEKSLTYSHQKSENCAVEKVNDMKALNCGSNKNKTLLKWIKSKGNRKTSQSKQNQQLITETLTVDNLPSLNDLDSLDLSTTSIHEKKKDNIFDKFTKIVHTKKTAMKA